MATKFVLFVEGKTERLAVPAFLKRWLDPQLDRSVGIKPVRFEGWAELVKDAPVKAKMYLKSTDVIGVVSLLDLYGPTIYPGHAANAQARVAWAKQHIEKTVGLTKFAQFFAVHEVEAWLLSQPALFPPDIRNRFPTKVANPETVNFNAPPAKMLDNVYTQVTRRRYKKVVFGSDLFSRLNPAVAYQKCPNLKALLDHMLFEAKAVGL
jgi:hypothetical protein